MVVYVGGALAELARAARTPQGGDVCCGHPIGPLKPCGGRNEPPCLAK